MDKPEEKIKDNDSQTHSESPFIQKVKSEKTIWKWLLIVTVFSLSILVSFYFLSPYSLINEIAIEGTNEVYDQHVLESSHLQSGDSLWENYINKSETENRIVNENPQVSDANLSFSGIHDFVIQIDEFETIAFLSKDNQYNKILENGMILDEVFPRPSSHQPILSGFSEGTALDVMLDEYVKIDNRVKMLISEIEYVENERNDMLVHVYMNDGNEVIASIPVFSERINYYPEMEKAVEGKKGLFDLEAGAYFIPYETEENESLEEMNLIDE